MKKLALILAVALWAMPALAGTPDGWLRLRLAQPPDELLPDRSGFSGDLSDANELDYAAIVKSVFRDAFARDVRARVIIIAPFAGGEYSIAIKERAGRFRVTAAHSTKWLWRYTPSGKAQAAQLRKLVIPADYHEVTVERCSAPIDSKLGKDLVTVWRTMLAGAAHHDWYSPPGSVARLHFSSSADKQILAGQTWVTFGGERVGSLILIADTLNQYCLHKKRGLVTEIRTEVDRLLSVLKSEQ
jgi:hypothetical protein